MRTSSPACSAILRISTAGGAIVISLDICRKPIRRTSYGRPNGKPWPERAPALQQSGTIFETTERKSHALSRDHEHPSNELSASVLPIIPPASPPALRAFPPLRASAASSLHPGRTRPAQEEQERQVRNRQGRRPEQFQPNPYHRRTASGDRPSRRDCREDEPKPRGC